MSKSSFITVMSGMSVAHFMFSEALIAALFPSSMGMFVYLFVTSMEHSRMSVEKVNGFYRVGGITYV